MMPVQRIMKYPLLLNRIYKATPRQCADRHVIKLALNKIEDQIAKINLLSKNLSSPNLKKVSSMPSLHDIDTKDSVNLIKMAANVLDWKAEETLLLLQDMFLFTSNDLIGSTKWSKKPFKNLMDIQLLLCVYDASENYEQNIEQTIEQGYHEKLINSGCEAKDAVVILLKKKSTEKLLIYKEPLHLQQCIISVNPNVPTAFELSGPGTTTMIFVAHSAVCSKRWTSCMQFVVRTLNVKWRLRRGGMSNIMIPTLQ